jgi:hypothetical protein
MAQKSMTNLSKSSLYAIEARLNELETAKVVGKTTENHGLIRPKEGVFITTTQFIIGSKKMIENESELISFAEKVKQKIGMTPSKEIKASAGESEIDLPILYFSEQVAIKQTQHTISISDEETRMQVFKDAFRPKSPIKITASDERASEFGREHIPNEVEIKTKEKALQRQIVVKIYPDLISADAAVKGKLREEFRLMQFEMEELGNFRFHFVRIPY